MNGVDVIVTSGDNADARLSPFMVTDTLATPTDGTARRSHKSSISETESRMSSAMSYASSYDPDNIALRHPVYSGSVSSVNQSIKQLRCVLRVASSRCGRKHLTIKLSLKYEL